MLARAADEAGDAGEVVSYYAPAAVGSGEAGAEGAEQ